jgi:hypothetical protein
MAAADMSADTAVSQLRALLHAPSSSTSLSARASAPPSLGDMVADPTVAVLHLEAQKHALARKAEEARLQAQRELEARLICCTRRAYCRPRCCRRRRAARAWRSAP